MHVQNARTTTKTKHKYKYIYARVNTLTRTKTNTNTTMNTDMNTDMKLQTLAFYANIVYRRKQIQTLHKHRHICKLYSTKQNHSGFLIYYMGIECIMTVLNDVETWNNVHYCNFLNTSSFDNCLCSQLGCFMAVSCMLYLHHIPLSLWIGTSVFGLFMSSVFPSTLAFAQKYIDVTGKTRANELNAHKTETNNIHKIRYL